MTPDEQVFLHNVLLAFEDLADRVVEKKALGATAFTVTAGPWTARLSDKPPFGDPALWDRTWGLWRPVANYVSTALANGCDHVIFHDDPWHVELHQEKVRTDEHA